MYKEIRPKMASEIIKLFIISGLVGLLNIILLDYTVIDNIVGIITVSLILFAAYWYTTFTGRPILFVTLFAFCLGLGMYALRYLERGEIVILGQSIYVPVGTGIIILQGCLIVFLLEVKDLISVIKGRVDAWFPPLWGLMIVVFLVLEWDSTVQNNIKRFSILILVVGLISVSFYKNSKTERKDIYYDVHLKGYFGHVLLLSILTLVGVSCLPKLESLPGARYFQRLNKSIIGQIETETTLNRNQDMSERLIYRVTSDEPLYLREAAYDYYDHGTWKMSKMNNDYHVLEENALKEESWIVAEIIDRASGKVGTMQQDKTAYIYEEVPQDNFLTANGTLNIQVDNPKNIAYYEDKNHICFTELKEKGYRAYTLQYANRTKMKEELLSSSGFASRQEWIERMQMQEVSKSIDWVEGIDYLSDKEYEALVNQYTQLPEELRNNADIKLLANELVNNLSKKYGQKIDAKAVIADSIAGYLKNSDQFKYVLGASYMDSKCDPIVDFLFNKSEGICQDFASSMVILCRSLDIPARYVVGYYSNEQDENGDYLIREKHGHAFVEVYIISYGWMLFDPTPSGGIELATGATGGMGGTIGTIALEEVLHISKNVIIVFLLAGAIVYLVRLISEAIWRGRILKIATKQAIDELTIKMLKLLESKAHPILEGETMSQLTERLIKEGINLSPITKLYDVYYYGGSSISHSQLEQAIACYRQLCSHKTWKIARK